MVLNSAAAEGRLFIMLALIQLMILILAPKSSCAQQGPLENNIPQAFLFNQTSDLVLPKGSYLLRVLVVGGGGGGCSAHDIGRGKSGEVAVSVSNITLPKATSFLVTVGQMGKSTISQSVSSNYRKDYQKSMFRDIMASGGKTCGTEKKEAEEEGTFGYFFMSSITKGRPGNSSDTQFGILLGGEGGIMINNTEPDRKAQKGSHSNSSEGGEGFGAGGGSGGKYRMPDETMRNIRGGHGAQGVVYIEVLPKVCRKPLRVFFALESGSTMNKQKSTVIGLLNFFAVSKLLGKVELVIYENETKTEFKFGEHNEEKDLIQAIEDIQDSNLAPYKADYTNVFKTALKAFQDSKDQYHQYDTKTLVLFSEFTNVNVSQELMAWKYKLQNIGVRVMVIGLAEDSTKKKGFLKQLAFDGNYVFTVADTYSIKKYWTRFANMICREPSYYVVKETPTSTTDLYARFNKKIQKEYLYILNYDITKADPNNMTEVKRVMAMAGNVIQNSQRMPNASQVAPGLKVIQFLEDYGLNMATKINRTKADVDYQHFEAGNIGMTLLQVKTKSVDKLSLSQFATANQKGSRNDHVVLPKEAFVESDSTRVVWLKLNPAMSMRQANNSFISSKVMSVKVEPKSPHHIFARPVELTFSISKVPKRYQVSCEFWDNSKRLTSPHGAWSSEGCMVVGQNETSVLCHCNHLTSFAVLTRIVHDGSRGEHDKYLSIITYIGCSLSILGCILTIITHACLPSLRTERSFIHLNLVTAILIAQILFFASASIRGPKGLCFTIGIALYFFYLGVFAWMLVEGLHIYCLVIRVFHTGHERKKLYTAIGWAFPALMTIVCAASFRDDFISDKLCWLSIETRAIWSFVGPALAIIAVNLVILVLVLRVTAGAMIQDETKNNPNDLRQSLSASHGFLFLHEDRLSKSLVRACITLLPILGLTWLFGILAINNKTVVFEYIFCIFNSIQGLLIFLFYCIGSSEVRRECKRKLHNYETKRSLRTSSSGFKSSKQSSSLSKKQSKSTELISQKEPQTNDDTRL